MSTNVSKVFDIMKTTGRAPAACHTGAYGVEIETETLKKYGQFTQLSCNEVK